MKNYLPKGKYAKINGVSRITSLLVFLLLTVSSFSQTCNISQVNTCNTAPVLACTTGTGLYSTDTALSLHSAPGYFLSCSGGGTSGYQYENSFDIPESQSASGCWKYSGVQRIGNLGGVLNLFQSSGSETSFTTPFFYMMPSDVVEMQLDVYRAGTSLFKINYYLENNLGVRTLQGTIDINSGHLTNTIVTYNPTITAPTTAPFRIYFELVASPAIPSGAKNRIDWLGINAPVYGTGCSGDANFSTTVTGLLPFFPVGSTPVTYTATYNSSAGTLLESKSCSYNVIVNKVTLSGVPTSATCTTNGSIQITAASANTSTNNLTYTINGGSPITLTGSLSTATTTAINEGVTTTTTYTTVTGTIPNLPAATYTIVVKDGTTNCSDSKDITVLKTADTEKPVLAAAPNAVSVECIGNITPMTNLTWLDNCDGGGSVTGVDGPLVGTTCSGTITRTWNVFDTAGNAAITRTQIITVKDDIAPTGTAPAGTANINACFVNASTVPVGTPAFNTTAAAAGYSDNCAGAVTATLTNTAVTGTNCSWTATYTFKVADACGNELTGQTISHTGGDKTAPTGTAPAGSANINACFVNGSTVPVGTPAFNATTAAAGYSDNCAGAVTAILTNTAVTGTNCSWTATYTFKVADACGNELTGQTISHTGGDKTAPTGTAPAGTANINACFVNGSTVPVGTPAFNATTAAAGYSDNCAGAVTATLTNTAVTGTNCSWTATYTFKVADACGNELTGQKISHTGGDKTAPTGTAPAGIANINACFVNSTTAPSGTPAFNATTAAAGYTDNCAGAVSATLTNTAVTGTNCSWTATYTFKVSDACGNELTGQTISHTGGDKTAPTGTAPAGTANINACFVNASTVPAGTPAFNATTAAAGYSDNCAGAVTAILTNTAVNGTNCSWTATYTFKVADACGNELTGQTISHTGGDKTAPTWTTTVGSLDTTIECSDAAALATAQALFPLASDNCDSTPIVIKTTGLFNQGSCALTGSYTNTWIATDNCGKVSSIFTQIITVQDTKAPITPTLIDVTVGECSGTPVAPTTTDICAGTLTGTTTTVFPITTQGTTVVTWTFSDCSGNSTTAIQNVIVDDTTKPVTPILLDVTVGECSGTPVAPTTTDICVGTLTGTTTTVFPITIQGTTVVTWTFDDGNGNSTTANQNVIVDDVTKPVTPTLENVIVGECSGTPVTPTTTDICAGTLTGTTTTVFPITTQGTTIVTWTFDDGNGNSTTANQNVIVDDVTKPVTPILVDVIVGECNGTPVAPTTTDICAGILTGTTTTIFPITTQGTTVVTWTFDDGNGNFTTANQNVIVDDTVAPVIPKLADVTGQCSATATTPTTTDGCAGTLTGTTADPLTYSTQGTHVITWTFDDGNGQSVTAMQNVIIDDTEAPVIPLLADVTGQCSATATAPTTTDVCAGTLTGTTTDPLTYSTQGTYVITWTFNDGNGQSVTAMQNVIIDDTENPVIPQLADVTGQCSATATAPTTTDVCAGTLTGTTSDPLTYNSQGTYVITWTFNDGNGQSVTATQNVIIDDTILPTAPILADVTGQCSATATTPTMMDNCSEILITGTTTDPVSYNTQGTYVITWTFDDGNGQSVTATQNVIVDDTIAPVIPVLADVNGQCSATAIVPTTTDNCTETITGTTTDPLTYSTQGTYVITWTFDDGNGQSVTAKQNMIVDDTEAPVIPVLADVTGQCSATVAVPTTTDVCAGALTGTTADPLIYSTQGSYVITWTFDDGNGQSVTAMQNVIVDDTENPVIPELADVTGQCSATATAPTTTDVCAGTITGTTSDPLTYNSQGTYVITWTFNDDNGQSVIAKQNVIIDDTILPTAPVLADVTGQCSATATAPTMMDNCNETLITGTTTDPLTYSTQGSYVITWTFDDGNGQSVTATQNVIVDDTEAPVIPVLADVIGQCSATATVPTTTDGCAGTLTGTTADPLTYSTQGTYVITWTFDDGNGQSLTATQNVIVDDTVAPVIPTLADVTGQCSATANAPTTTDVCAGTLTGTTTDPLVYSTQGNHVITWTFNDGNGQSITATQNVIVDDTVAPAIPVLADVTGQCSAETSVPTTDDNCAGTITGTTTDPLTYSTQGTHIITWTFSDGNGQSVTATQNIIVKDSGAPTISAAGANATIACPATPTFTAPTSSDTCGTTTVNEISTITTPGNCEGSYSVTRTWDATDANGNHSTTVSQTIIVQDLTGPTTTTAFPPSIDVKCDAIPTKPELVFVDNCSTVATPVYTEKIINQTPTSYSIEREWNITDTCGNPSKFVQLVNVTIANTGIVITSSACNADSTPIDLNTLLPADTPTNGVWTNVDNVGILQGSIFYPLDATLGNHIFQYKVTDGSCPLDIKINMNVNFDCKVLGCEAIVVHKAFSPNGDGINEQLVIDGVEDTICYPTGIYIEIYNRWGVLVFETSKYDNTNNVFDGYSRGRTTVSKSDGLPTGTYFYILNYESFDGSGNIQMNRKDGFIYLSR